MKIVIEGYSKLFMIKSGIFILGLLLAVSASAQLNTMPVNTKVEEGFSKQTQINEPIATAKKDTNTFTVINITESTSSKNAKSKLKTDKAKPIDDIKTSVVKAKQSSKHWFDTFLVNIICVGVNKFVKND